MNRDLRLLVSGTGSSQKEVGWFQSRGIGGGLISFADGPYNSLVPVDKPPAEDITR